MAVSQRHLLEAGQWAVIVCRQSSEQGRIPAGLVGALCVLLVWNWVWYFLWRNVEMWCVYAGFRHVRPLCKCVVIGPGWGFR